MGDSMQDDFNYEFKISGFTPETMPFDRLVDYFGKLRALFPKPNDVHLVGIKEGSVATAFAVEQGEQQRLRDHFQKLHAGKASRKASEVFEDISGMLHEDNATAVFLDREGAEVIAFSGREVTPETTILPRSGMNVRGYFRHLSEDGGVLKLRVATEDYGLVYADAPDHLRDLLKQYLFAHVELACDGVWILGPDRVWKPREVEVHDVFLLQNKTLSEAVDRLREVEVNWPSDPIKVMRQIREEDDDSL